MLRTSTSSKKRKAEELTAAIELSPEEIYQKNLHTREQHLIGLKNQLFFQKMEHGCYSSETMDSLTKEMKSLIAERARLISQYPLLAQDNVSEKWFDTGLLEFNAELRAQETLIEKQKTRDSFFISTESKTEDLPPASEMTLEKVNKLLGKIKKRPLKPAEYSQFINFKLDPKVDLNGKYTILINSQYILKKNHIALQKIYSLSQKELRVILQKQKYFYETSIASCKEALTEVLQAYQITGEEMTEDQSRIMQKLEQLNTKKEVFIGLINSTLCQPDDINEKNILEWLYGQDKPIAPVADPLPPLPRDLPRDLSIVPDLDIHAITNETFDQFAIKLLSQQCAIDEFNSLCRLSINPDTDSQKTQLPLLLKKCYGLMSAYREQCSSSKDEATVDSESIMLTKEKHIDFLKALIAKCKNEISFLEKVIGYKLETIDGLKKEAEKIESQLSTETRSKEIEQLIFKKNGIHKEKKQLKEEAHIDAPHCCNLLNELIKASEKQLESYGVAFTLSSSAISTKTTLTKKQMDHKVMHPKESKIVNNIEISEEKLKNVELLIKQQKPLDPFTDYKMLQDLNTYRISYKEIPQIIERCLNALDTCNEIYMQAAMENSPEECYIAEHQHNLLINKKSQREKAIKICQNIIDAFKDQINKINPEDAERYSPGRIQINNLIQKCCAIQIRAKEELESLPKIKTGLSDIKSSESSKLVFKPHSTFSSSSSSSSSSEEKKHFAVIKNGGAAFFQDASLKKQILALADSAGSWDKLEQFINQAYAKKEPWLQSTLLEATQQAVIGLDQTIFDSQSVFIEPGMAEKLLFLHLKLFPNHYLSALKEAKMGSPLESSEKIGKREFRNFHQINAVLSAFITHDEEKITNAAENFKKFLKSIKPEKIIDNGYHLNLIHLLYAAFVVLENRQKSLHKEGIKQVDSSIQAIFNRFCLQIIGGVIQNELPPRIRQLLATGLSRILNREKRPSRTLDDSHDAVDSFYDNNGKQVSYDFSINNRSSSFKLYYENFKTYLSLAHTHFSSANLVLMRR